MIIVEKIYWGGKIVCVCNWIGSWKNGEILKIYLKMVFYEFIDLIELIYVLSLKCFFG